MFKHNLVLIARSIFRFKGVFFINLTGLSTALASVMFIYLWVADELSFDQYHKHIDRIYQVMENQSQNDQTVTSGGTADFLSTALTDELPEIELASVATPPFFFPLVTLTSGNISVKGSVKFADQNFFKIFSYPLQAGDASSALNDKSNIVISESLAKKLFGNPHQAIGKQVNWHFPGIEGLTVVSGVFEDVPVNSSETFDFVLPFDAFRQIMGSQNAQVNWDNRGPFLTYIILQDEADANQVSDQINQLLKTKASNAKDRSLFLKAYGDQYLYNHYENGKQAGGRIDYVIMFSIVAGIILLIACINFVNLSTARALQRAKAVGVQRIIGAGQRTLVFQHLQEAFMMVVLASFAAVVLVNLLLSQFNMLTGKNLAVTIQPQSVIFLVLLILVITLLSGIYPAFYLISFNPIRVIKGQITASIGEHSARRGLIVFQFGLTVIFLVAVIVVQQQMEFIQTRNLGFDKQNVLYFEADGKVSQHTDAFIAELSATPGVTMASSMLGSLIHAGDGSGMPGSLTWQGKTITINSAAVNYGLIELLGMEMKAGRTFSKDIASDKDKVIYNEAAIDALGIEDPIGKKIGEREILGVVKNFHYESFHEPVKPHSFRLEPSAAITIMVKVEPGKEQHVIDAVKKLYASYNPGVEFNYAFLDKNFQALYAGERRVSALAQYAAGLAIVISCLGLFGLMTFTVERRIKEIGIRKVFGSGKIDIILLLSFDFSKLIVISILIAFPLSYYLAHSWLENFAYHIEFRWWYPLLAVGMILIISWLTIAALLIKAAKTNPVSLLRSE